MILLPRTRVNSLRGTRMKNLPRTQVKIHEDPWPQVTSFQVPKWYSVWIPEWEFLQQTTFTKSLPYQIESITEHCVLTGMPDGNLWATWRSCCADLIQTKKQWPKVSCTGLTWNCIPSWVRAVCVFQCRAVFAPRMPRGENRIPWTNPIMNWIDNTYTLHCRAVFDPRTPRGKKSRILWTIPCNEFTGNCIHSSMPSSVCYPDAQRQNPEFCEPIPVVNWPKTAYAVQCQAVFDPWAQT